MKNITDRFNSNEEQEIPNTDEFCEGEQARISGLTLKDNPYKDFQNQSSNHWAKGWCDRDMILAAKNVHYRPGEEELIDHLELIKSDLRWQLSFEEVDWDHFGEFVKSAKVIRDNIEKLKLAERAKG